MRALTSREITKRGCVWCLDHKKVKILPDDSKRNHVCIHNICPYRELDPYDTYDDFLKHHKDAGLDELIGSVFRLQRDL